MNTQISTATGPKTPEGKAISSRNAVQHGLSAQSIEMLPNSYQLEYIDYHAQVTKEYAPANIIEQLEIDAYAFASFMGLRAYAMEAQALAATIANPNDEVAAKHHQRMVRYQCSLSRRARQAMKQFRTLQADRLAQAEIQAILDEQFGGNIQVPVSLPITALRRDFKKSANPNYEIARSLAKVNSMRN
jgi:hypothetical protein